MKTLAVLTLAAMAATGAFAQERGRVLSSTPITRLVAVPQQVCADQGARQCSTQTFYQNRIVGYDVSYEYNGRNYSTQTASQPGTWIVLSVQPQPNDGYYASNGYYSSQTPPQAAYSTTYSTTDATSYPDTGQSAYYEPQPAAPAYSGADYVAPLLIGAVIGAGILYATRPGHHGGGHGGGYYPPRPVPHGHGWRR